jgi:hypothetical protein
MIIIIIIVMEIYCGGKTVYGAEGRKNATIGMDREGGDDDGGERKT